MISSKQKKIDKFNYSLQTMPVAIIGMAAIFPQAENLPEYWDNILRKIDCITEVPSSRWNVEDYYDSDPTAPDKVYCKRGGFIPDIEFDLMEFGLPPNILESTDVSQLLSLVVAKDALEDAGCGSMDERTRDRTGVILGAIGMSSKLFTPLMSRLQYPVWEKVLKSSGLSDEDISMIIEKIKLGYIQWTENSFPGSIVNVITGRIANRFDLGGTNCVVDAACASSMAAIKMAVFELINGRADMMITGGVDTDNSVSSYMCFSKTPAFSRGERVRAFDAKSDGMMVGEGIGMVVLKRQEDAERDQDRIYALIKGIGSSSDGRAKSIYAPRSSGQAKAMRRAYQDAGFSQYSVGLIEAHGTGTIAGDPAEFQGLKEAFGDDDLNRQHIALGTVKSQIGHTKAAAGAASLIKTALALYHKVLPPTINVEQPHPKMEINNSPFYLNTETRPWISSDDNVPRRAGVSSFGFGGTNFHVVLEEYKREHNDGYRLQSTSQSIILHAPGVNELLALCQDKITRLQSENREHGYAEMVADSISPEIPIESARLGFVAASLEEAQKLLLISVNLLKEKARNLSWEHPKGIYYRKTGLDPAGKVVALFPGQGSQYLEMGRELAKNFPPLREAYHAMDGLFIRDGLEPLSETVFPIPVFDPHKKEMLEDRLRRTENAQPAIAIFCVGLYKLLHDAGFKPDFTAGHSFGELAALWAAGVLTERDYFYLAKSRGKAMSPPDDPDFDAGAMLAIKGEISGLSEEIKSYPEITLANVNSNNQVVLAGSKSAIAEIQKVLSEKGHSVFLLPVSAAFHTKLVGHAQKPFAKIIEAINFNVPTVPVYSNTTAKAYSKKPDTIRKALANHILKPVVFRDEIKNIYDQGGRIFIEIGPKSVLTKLVKNILEGESHVAIALNASSKKDSDRQFRQAVVQMRVAGIGLQNVDPYQVVSKDTQPRGKKSLKVTLNGGYYITDKTKEAFEQALQDGQRVDSPAALLGVGASSVPSGGTVPAAAQATPNGDHGLVPVTEKQEVYVQHNLENALDYIEQSLEQLQAHQNKSLQVHEQYLQNDAEYAKIFFRLSELEISLVSNGNYTGQQFEKAVLALESLERGIMHFHDHQNETLRIHEQYLNSQAEFSQNFINLVQKKFDLLASGDAALRGSVPSNAETKQHESAHASMVVIDDGGGNGNKPLSDEQVAESSTHSEEMLPPASSPAIDVVTISSALLNVVSEKTGYPAEMLELDMDMEADLGIDSIKRVEILGAIQDQFPELPKVEAQDLAELRTLGQIIDYMGTHPGKSENLPMVSPELQSTAPSAESTQPTTESIGIETISATLLEVVAEKTGYPVEMLELDMDMEADLGIDSIKRVEILGAIQDQFPELPKVEAEDLTELQTLGQIIVFLKAPGQSSAVAIETEVLKSDGIADRAIPRGVVKSKPLPEPDFIDFSLPKNHVYLLTDDGTEVTGNLAKILAEQGSNVVVLSFPQSVVANRSPLPESVFHVVLEDTNEGNLKKQLDVAVGKYGPVAVFIHLDPPCANHQDEEISFSESEEAIVRHVFLLAKYLKEDLNNAAREGYGAFMTVTRLDGEFGIGGNNGFDPTSGGLFGLVKTLSLEWDGVFCRALDLSPEFDAVEYARRIIAELHDPNRLIIEVAHNQEGRSTLIVEGDAAALEVT